MDIYAIVCMSRFRQQTDALAMARVDIMNVKIGFARLREIIVPFARL